jgi:transcriptional regulator with XRE-family HTH domain
MVSVGKRIKHLLDTHKHSLRQAEKRTGVSYETIRRICNGYEGPTVHYYVRKIAQGYGINERALLEGLDPKGDFEFTIHHAPPDQRLDLMIMSRQERLRLTLDFIRSKYPSALPIPVLEVDSGLETQELAALIARWQQRPPDRVTTLAISRGVSRLTGIPMKWFLAGWLDAETPEKPFADRACRLCSKGIGQTKVRSDLTKQVIQIVQEIVAGVG